MIHATYNFLLGNEVPLKWDDSIIICKKTGIKDLSFTEATTKCKNCYTLNKKNGDVYWRKTPYDVREVSIVLLFCYPLYGVGFSMWHTLRIPFDTLKIAYATFGEFGQYYCEQRYLEIAKLFYKKPIEILSKGICANLYNLARDPYFAIKLFFTCAITALAPKDRLLDGEEQIASLEAKWHHHVSYTKDIRYSLKDISSGFQEIREGSFLQGITKIYKAIYKAEVFYLPFCMILRGNIHAENSLYIVESPEVGTE